MDAIVLEMVNSLDSVNREVFEERAAILEFEANYERAHAECLSLLSILRKHDPATYPVAVWQVEVKGETKWMLVTDVELAKAHLAYIGGRATEALDLFTVVEWQCHGIAVLTAA